jgi:hypothetical protein
MPRYGLCIKRAVDGREGFGRSELARDECTANLYLRKNVGIPHRLSRVIPACAGTLPQKLIATSVAPTPRA